MRVMKNFLLQFFTWWNGQTLGTRFFTWRKGERIGEDEQGNVFYKDGKGRRWVIYNGEAEPSRISSGWHGWMHHRTDISPSEEDYAMREWELPHKQNLTGTAGAYRPRGSLLNPDRTSKPATEYDAWSP